MVYGRCSGGVQEVCHPHNGFFYISTIRTEKEKKKVGYRSRRITVFGDLKNNNISFCLDDCELKECFAHSDTFTEECYATNGTIHGLTLDICVCRADWCTSLPYSSSTSLAMNFAFFGVLALSIFLK